MFEKETDYIPFNKCGTNSILVGGNFPEWLDVSKIGINQKRLQRLLTLSGIGGLLIFGSNGETSKDFPMIAGFNQSGEAYAAKGSTQTIIPTHDVFSSDIHNSNISHYIRQKVCSVVLNENEITQRIQQNNKYNGNIRSNEAWSYYIDHSIRDGIQNVGIKHLILGLNKRDLTYMGLIYGPAIAYGGLSGGYTQFLAAYAGVLGLHLISSKLTPNFRFSLLIPAGPQLDRAAVLFALCKTSTLAKPL